MMKKTNTISTTTWFWFITLICIFCLASCKTEHCASDGNNTVIKSLIQFGDSFSDTGNALRLAPESWIGKYPNGITIGKPNGRLSDGLIIIDYIAKSLGLNSPKPYLDDTTAKRHSNSSNVVNFAVAGATALSADTLKKRWNLSLPFTNATLDVQLQWFRRYLQRHQNRRPKNNNNSDRKKPLLKTSLLAIEIGGNDYTTFLLTAERSKAEKQKTLFSAAIDEAKKSMLPLIINKIRDTMKEFISDGATQVFVHGLYPYGCSPSLLTRLPKLYKNLTHDKLGCLKEVNDFVKYHNHRLQQMLIELQRERNSKAVNIIYVDIYEIMISILTDHSPSRGITKGNVACCGAGGKYNYRPDVKCGDYEHGSRPCKEPGKYVFWDEWHISQAASKLIAKRIIPKILKALPCA